MPQVITLTTDFGTRDGYVGALKGVALGINPDVALVDISHDIPPQDIAHGAFVIGSTYRYFPDGTIHVGVVDPGVGTSRGGLLVITPVGRFLAPDNGLLTYVLADHLAQDTREGLAVPRREFMEPIATPVPGGCSAYWLTSTEYWRHPVSDTFHGRDIFVPVAAHLSLGVRPDQMGEAVDEVICLSVPPPREDEGAVEGRVIFVDRFGNLVSNIRSAHLGGGSIQVEIERGRVGGLGRTYGEGTGLRALIGSHGYLEIAERNDSAADRLAAGVGSVVRVTASS